VQAIFDKYKLEFFKSSFFIILARILLLWPHSFC